MSEFHFGQLTLTPSTTDLFVLSQDGTGFMFGPGFDGRSGVITAHVLVTGATPVQMRDRVRDIEQEIERATRAARDRHSQLIEFRARVDNGEWATWQVLGGPESHLRAVQQINPSTLHAILTLQTLPVARGDVITLPWSDTLASGDTLHVPAVAGDAPAWMRLEIEDVSTGESAGERAINRVRIATLSGEDLMPEDVALIWDAVPHGDGSSVVSDDAIGGAFARVSTTGEDWHTIAKIERPTPRTNGLFDLYLRYRDGSVRIPAPTGFSASYAGARAAILQHTVLSAENTNEVVVEWPQETEPGSTLVMAVQVWVSDNITYNQIPSVHPIWTDRGNTNLGTGGTGSDLLARSQTRVYEVIAHAGGRTTERVRFATAIDGSIAVHLYEFRGKLEQGTSNGRLHNASTTAHHTAVTDATTTLPKHVVVGFHTFDDITVSYTSPWILQTNGARMATAYTGPNTTAGVVGEATSTNSVRSSNRSISFVGPIPPTALLSPGQYTYVLAHRNASNQRGFLSAPVFVEVPFIGRVSLSWDALPSGADNSLLYVQRTAPDGTVGDWRAVTMGSATSYDHDSTTAGSVSGPPSAQLIPSEFRLQIAAGSGEIVSTLAPVPTLVGSRFHLMHAATQSLPPHAAGYDRAADDWSMLIQARHTMLELNVDLDAIWAAPHNDSQAEVSVPGMALTTPRDWDMDALRDGSTSAVLLNAGAVVGSLAYSQRIRIGPDDALLSVMFDGEDERSNVEHLRARVRLSYRSAYRSLRGWR